MPAHASSTNAPPTRAGWMRLNDLLGVPLWSDYNLWDVPEREVARRLRLPEESRTSRMSSYRAYGLGKNKVLGESWYSVALFCDTAHVTGVSIVFANKGDLVTLAEHFTESGDRVPEDERASRRAAALRTYVARIEAAARNVESNLTSLLHAPATQQFGEGNQMTRETVKRWNVKGHAIILAAPPGEYVALRIVPAALADAEGKGQRLSDEEVAERFRSSVSRRANGDVIIKDIPMIDQGPKGYCVPATWARYCLYAGIPADLYLFGMTAETTSSGSHMDTMAQNVDRLVSQHNRRIRTENRRALIKYLDGYIDSGVPLIIAISCDDEFYHDQLTERAGARRNVADMKSWAASLQQYRLAAKKLPARAPVSIGDAGLPVRMGHACMVIGYNKATREIALSDSWGAMYEERWLTEEEADAICMGTMYVIKW